MSQPSLPDPSEPPRRLMNHPDGTTVLVLGILGPVCCGLFAPFAWWMGSQALKEIDRSPDFYGNRQVVQAGRILGMVTTILLALVLLLYGVVALTASGSLATA